MRKTMLKTFALTLSLALVATGCGNKNKSGRSNGYYSQLGLSGIPNISPNVNMAAFGNIPCSTGSGRQQVQFNVPLNATINTTYVGVTLEGDLAFITASGAANQGIFTASICQRYGLTGSGRLAANPTINVTRSYTCPFGEITAATMYLQGQGGYYTLAFFPIWMLSQYRTAVGCY